MPVIEPATPTIDPNPAIKPGVPKPSEDDPWSFPAPNVDPAPKA